MAATWGTWVRDQMARYRWEQADAARASGLPRSAISQWLDKPETRPTVENVRKFAVAVDIPLVRALVHAGYLTAEEANMPKDEFTIREVTNAELLAELERRLATGSAREPHEPDLPPVEVSWSRAAAPSQAKTETAKRTDHGRRTN